jgi:serine/threonine kinase 3
LLSSSGNCKLADFGVSAELTNTMQKRRTVIGTPFWMAPGEHTRLLSPSYFHFSLHRLLLLIHNSIPAEVIQETSYDGRADIWSLGITIIEMCEGQPPHYNVHPMRAIFMIPMKPPPTLKNASQWPPHMEDFVTKCLKKNPDERATSAELIEHAWIKDDVEEIRQHGFSPVLKSFFDANIEAVVRMRNGEDDPEEEAEVGSEVA